MEYTWLVGRKGCRRRLITLDQGASCFNVDVVCSYSPLACVLLQARYVFDIDIVINILIIIQYSYKNFPFEQYSSTSSSEGHPPQNTFSNMI